MGSGPSHEKDDPNNNTNNTNNTNNKHQRGSTVGDPASMRRMHWIIYDAKGKHSIIAEHDVVTGRRLLVADGTQIVYRKRVLMDRGDTFPFTIGNGTYIHHCVAFIRDIEFKFLYGLVVDGLPIHEYHQKFFQNALYYTFPITVSPFSPTHQYTPSSQKSEPSPLMEAHVQNLAGIEEAASPLESDVLSPQDAASVIDTLTTSAVVSRRKSRDVSADNSPEHSVAAAISTQSSMLNPVTGERSTVVTPRTPPAARHCASKSVVSSVPIVPATSAEIPASATYTVHDPRHHTCIVITHPQLAVLIDDEPVELHSQFAELTTELFNKDNHVHDGEDIHIAHHDAQHEPSPVEGTIHGFTCDSYLTVCELITRPIAKSRASVGTRSTLSPPVSGNRHSLTIHTGNTDTIPLITPSPHTSPHHHHHPNEEKKLSRSRESSTSPGPNHLPGAITDSSPANPASPAALALVASATVSATSPAPPTSTSATTSPILGNTTISTSSKSNPSLFEYELRVNGFVQESLPPPPVPYFNQVAIQEQQAMEIPVPRLKIEYEKWRESHSHSTNQQPH